MKMNKKLLAVMMSIVVVGTTFVGCGNKENADTNSTVTEQPSDQTEDAPATPEEPVVEEESVEEEVVEDNVGTEEGAEGEEYVEADPTPSQELVYVVTDGIELPPSTQMPAEMFADTYGIDTSILDSYYVQMPMMNVHANEIAVFEVKDEADIEAVKAGIEKRQDSLEQQWASYLPEQLELVKNYKVEVKGNRVIFVVSDVADQIIEKFKAAE